MSILQRSITTAVVAFVPVMFACNKPAPSADAGTSTTTADAATTDAATDVVDAAAAPSASAATAAGPAKCVGKQKAFYGTGGAQLCETPCTSQSDCKLPATCWGNGELLNADGSKGKAETYCKAPSAATTCPKGQIAFVAFVKGADAKVACETPCGGNADCAAPMTCKGDAYLMIGDMSHGPAQHYCQK